jgi:hypothetical protein
MTTGTVHGSRVRQALTRLSGSREVLWIGSGQAGAVLAALAGVTWLTKFLPPGEYGQLALMLTLANLVGLVIFGPLAAGSSSPRANGRSIAPCCRPWPISSCAAVAGSRWDRWARPWCAASWAVRPWRRSRCSRRCSRSSSA